MMRTAFTADINYNFLNFGPIPPGWRIRSLNYEMSPSLISANATLAVRVGFLPSPLVDGFGPFNDTELLRRSSRMVVGDSTQAVRLISYIATAGVSPFWRFSLPTSVPLHPDWDLYLCVEHTIILNVIGVASVDLIPLSTFELSRIKRRDLTYIEPPL